MEKELRVRDDIIHELEVRLTLPPNSEDMLNGGGDTPDYTIEMKNLQTQLEALQTALAHKDNEIEALKVVASEAEAAANTISGKELKFRELGAEKSFISTKGLLKLLNFHNSLGYCGFQTC